MSKQPAFLVLPKARAGLRGGGHARSSADALARLSRHGYSEEEIFALVVPKRTLARRKAANEPLTDRGNRQGAAARAHRRAGRARVRRRRARRIAGCARRSASSTARRRSPIWRAKPARASSRKCCSASSTASSPDQRRCGYGGFPTTPACRAMAGSTRPAAGTRADAASSIWRTIRPRRCSR